MDILVIIARLLFPILILRFPLAGGLLALFLDGVDWPYSMTHGTLNYITYPLIDKLLDLYYLSLEMMTLTSWKDKTAKKIGYALYWWRFIGVVLFSFTSVRFFLFLFPNIYEMFFLFFVANKYITQKEFLPKRILFLFLFGLLVPKLFQEYLMHVALLPIWQFSEIHIYSFQLPYDNLYGQCIFILIFLLFAKRFASVYPKTSS